MAVHMAESPIACLAAVHAAATPKKLCGPGEPLRGYPLVDDLVTGCPSRWSRTATSPCRTPPAWASKSLVDDVIARSPGAGRSRPVGAHDEWDDDVCPRSALELAGEPATAHLSNSGEPLAGARLFSLAPYPTATGQARGAPLRTSLHEPAFPQPRRRVQSDDNRTEASADRGVVRNEP